MLKLLQITKRFWIMIIMHISDTLCAKTILNGIHLVTFMSLSGNLLGNGHSLGKLYILFVQVTICYFGGRKKSHRKKSHGKKSQEIKSQEKKSQL